jgi:AAA-like domain
VTWFAKRLSKPTSTARSADASIPLSRCEIAFTGALPYRVAAIVDPLQYALWRDGDSIEALVARLVKALSGAGDLLAPAPADNAEDLDALAASTEIIGAPLPSADIRPETGMMTRASPFYVERISDATMQEALSAGAATILIRGPRQFGKSSLLARAIAGAKDLGRTVFFQDFQALDKAQLESLETLLRYLARRMTRAAGLDAQTDRLWDPCLSAKQNLTDLVGDVLLDGPKNRLTFVLDEVDRVFACDFRDEFFSLIRVWHNQRSTDDRWSNVDLIVSHSTEPTLWIQDLDQSPFNVGERLSLSEFDAEQIAYLNRLYGNVLSRSEEIDALLELVGGHPFLVRQALYAMRKTPLSFAELLGVATDDRGPFGDHLRRVGWTLQRDVDLGNDFRRSLSGRGCESERHFQRLLAAGLVQGNTRQSARARCTLYDRYFSRHL